MTEKDLIRKNNPVEKAGYIGQKFKEIEYLIKLIREKEFDNKFDKLQSTIKEDLILVANLALFLATMTPTTYYKGLPNYNPVLLGYIKGDLKEIITKDKVNPISILPLVDQIIICKKCKEPAMSENGYSNCCGKEE